LRLPNVDVAISAPAKLRDYRLSPEHPVGRAKARYFATLGFTRDRWPLLEQALLAHARAGVARPELPSPFGRKYQVEGILQGPTRSCSIVAIWLLRTGDERPPFITAFPR
jgi:hypothetical protein